MSTSQSKTSKNYAYLPRTRISNSTGIHTSLRRTCDNLWSSRANGCDFRLVRTNSWGAWGRGSPGYQLKKFDDTYVIGFRAHSIEREKYPQYSHLAHGGYIPVEKIPKDSVKALDYFWGRRPPFFIIKPEHTLMPMYIDKGRENMMWGMRLYQYTPESVRHILTARELEAFGGAFIGGAWAMGTYYVQGGLVFTDEGVDTYGTTLKDPVAQIYDKGLYNKGLKALHTLRDLLKIYIDRHKVIEEANWWNCGWREEFVWKVIHMYQDRGIEGLTPHWIIKHNRMAIEEHGGYNLRWMQDRLLQVAQLKTPQIQRLWRNQALKHGICRFVERDTPVYNEVPPLKPVTIDYDRVIRDD